MGERIYLLPKEGNLYKANMHCHTTVSDGKFTPEEIKNMYKARGYHAVAFTDHQVYVHGRLYSHRAALVAGEDSIECIDIEIDEKFATSGYFFVTVVDKSGKRAWSIPYSI